MLVGCRRINLDDAVRIDIGIDHHVLPPFRNFDCLGGHREVSATDVNGKRFIHPNANASACSKRPGFMARFLANFAVFV